MSSSPPINLHNTRSAHTDLEGLQHGLHLRCGLCWEVERNVGPAVHASSPVVLQRRFDLGVERSQAAHGHEQRGRQSGEEGTQGRSRVGSCKRGMDATDRNGGTGDSSADRSTARTTSRQASHRAVHRKLRHGKATYIAVQRVLRHGKPAYRAVLQR